MSRNTRLSEDDDEEDGRSKHQELSGKDSEQVSRRDEAENQRMIVEKTFLLEGLMTNVGIVYGSDDDTWGGFSDEDFASRRSPV